MTAKISKLVPIALALAVIAPAAATATIHNPQSDAAMRKGIRDFARNAVKGKTVKALALNDYATQIPMEDFAKFGVILALKRDGEYMPVRDKGPLFIVYPYDSKPELKSQTYYGRSAWQLKRLEITD